MSQSAVLILPAHKWSKMSFEEWSTYVDEGPLRHPMSIENVADLVSRSFLASPIFAGIEPERYQPEPVMKALRLGRPWVAWYGNDIIGSVTLFPPNPESACPAFRDTPTLGLLAVDSYYGGNGVSVMLMDEIEAEAVRQGYPKIALSVTQRGTALIAFYERRGYRKVGTMQWPNAVGPSQIMVKEF